MEATAEIGELRIRLKDGLRCHLREQSGEASFLIHDPIAGKHFHVGLSEYAFLTLLDGRKTLQEALEALSSNQSDLDLTIEQAFSISHWLVKSGLANVVSDDADTRNRAIRLLERSVDDRARKRTRNANPLFLRVPVANPAAAFDYFNRWTRHLATPVVLFWMAAVSVFALLRLPQFIDQTGQVAHGIIARDNWLWLTITIIGLKIVHEVAHGIVAARYRVPPKSFGFVFILCVPIPYLDVSDSWTLNSKWQRIAIAAAGMVAELFLASLALLMWMQVRDPVIQQHLFNLVVAASVTTLVFNANFLIRFDGYYILSDWLEVPNLASSSSHYLRYFFCKHWFGLRVQLPASCRRRRSILFSYAVLATCWRIVVCATLTLAAAAMFQGFGLILAALAMAMWLLPPMVKLAKFLTGGNSIGRPHLGHFALRTAPVLAVLMLAMALPLGHRIQAPGVIRFADAEHIRTQVDGLLARVCVKDGQVVHAGDPLLEIENPDLQAELQELQLEREQSMLKVRQLFADRQISAYQAELVRRDTIDGQIARLAELVESLTVRAGRAGFVVAPELNSQVGKHFPRGTEILLIGNAEEKEIVAALATDDAGLFRQFEQRQLEFLTPSGAAPMRGTLSRVESSARFETDVRLTAWAGGPLAVRERSELEMPTQSASSPEATLVKPRIQAVITLSPEASKQFAAGSTATILLPDRRHWTDQVAEQWRLAREEVLDHLHF